MNHARLIAVRLKNKPRVDYEQCLAHGRVVFKKDKPQLD